MAISRARKESLIKKLKESLKDKDLYTLCVGSHKITVRRMFGMEFSLREGNLFPSGDRNAHTAYQYASSFEEIADHLVNWTQYDYR